MHMVLMIIKFNDLLISSDAGNLGFSQLPSCRTAFQKTKTIRSRRLEI